MTRCYDVNDGGAPPAPGCAGDRVYSVIRTAERRTLIRDSSTRFTPLSERDTFWHFGFPILTRAGLLTKLDLVPRRVLLLHAFLGQAAKSAGADVQILQIGHADRPPHVEPSLRHSVNLQMTDTSFRCVSLRVVAGAKSVRTNAIPCCGAKMHQRA